MPEGLKLGFYTFCAKTVRSPRTEMFKIFYICFVVGALLSASFFTRDLFSSIVVSISELLFGLDTLFVIALISALAYLPVLVLNFICKIGRPYLVYIPEHVEEQIEQLAKNSPKFAETVRRLNEEERLDDLRQWFEAYEEFLKSEKKYEHCQESFQFFKEKTDEAEGLVHMMRRDVQERQSALILPSEN